MHPESSEDDDSGVEEAAVFHPAGRRRSVVSFNLTPSLGEAPSPDTDRDAENEGIMYLPLELGFCKSPFKKSSASLLLGPGMVSEATSLSTFCEAPESQ